MAKARIKGKSKGTNGKPAIQNDGRKASQGGETVAGYFRKIFNENPKLLKGRSNEELLKRWLADHPGLTEVPQTVKYNLANVKSVLRKKLRKRGGRPKADQTGAVAAVVTVPKVAARGLEALEEQIDDCLSSAKRLDREGLADVIGLLRRARNVVVWKAGQ
jgi:hypothetical protein